MKCGRSPELDLLVTAGQQMLHTYILVFVVIFVLNTLTPLSPLPVDKVRPLSWIGLVGDCWSADAAGMTHTVGGYVT